MRLIDADALLNELEKVRCSLQMNDNTQRADLIMSGLYVAKRHIQEMPTVDAVPVRHGRWIPVEDDDMFCCCSECGTNEYRETIEVLRYEHCPYCGAMMDYENT